MQIHFGPQTWEYPGPSLGELTDSTDLLLDAAALRQRFERDGYLLLRGLIERERVLAARAAVFQYMSERQGLEPGSRPLDGVMGQYGKSVGMMGRRPITHQPDVQHVLEGPPLRGFFDRFFGEPCLTFDYKWLRAVGREGFTGAHYDVVYMGRGSERLMTTWIPIGDLEMEHGVLAICEGSHNSERFARLRQTYGRMDVDRDRVEGWFTNDPLEIVEQFGGQWKTTRFQAGDVLIFGMYTLHASTTNVTDRWRLSCDVRFQPASDPVDERWVGATPKAHYAWQTEPDKLKPMKTARAEWGV
jgi:hypothetical protein